MKAFNFQINYKLFFGFLSFITIFSCYLYKIIDGSEVINNYSGNYEIYTIDFFTTFTLLSNVFVQVWFLYAGFNHKNEGKTKFLSHTTANSLATMITVTFLVYNFVLVPIDTGFPKAHFDRYVTVVDHMITPIAFVIYVIFFMANKEKISLNQFFIKKFWTQFTLVLGYCIFAMLRGELRYGSNSDLYYKEENGEVVRNIFYPYFFLDVHHQGPLGLSGAVWFIIAFVLIVSIMIAFSYLYNFLSNIMMSKNYYKKISK
ncbi:Pr6Pr family membrane protein [Spiroplasma taiwanense]|uniref:Transmembrane protein n=1 Tax=Spiroplasma taiwanense CT-1 TaxID=1276220 RepID=S5MH39_9MOLU|nr:hypothetical protein [Spiroplasma taiwanense]AGR41155.1 hypothetical protein STAIW_v1c05260 [Spiroplasma taiwanense CT-1]